MWLTRLWLSIALLWGGMHGAWADWQIGRTAGFTGPGAVGVKEATDGAQLWLDAVNERGGVHGQKVAVLTLDDKFDPKLTVDNTRKLIEEQNVLAMFLSRGTPHTEAMIPLLEQYGVPLVGPSTGAMVLHQPVKKYIFNVRATYQREAEKLILHISRSGVQRIAVVYVDDSFGQDVLQGAQKGFAQIKRDPVLLEHFDRSKPDFVPVIQHLAQTAPQSVLIVASGGHFVEIVKGMRAAGVQAQVMTLSNNASGGVIKSLGEHARGVIVAQTFPGERAMGYPMVREALALAKAKGLGELTPAMLEGYAAAKVLVEALRQAGPKVTRERLQAALEGMRHFDLGGLELGYSPSDHTGLDFADLSIIDHQGQFKR